MGTSGEKGMDVTLKGALWGFDSPPITISLYNMYILLNLNTRFLLQASDIAPLSNVYPQR